MKILQFLNPPPPVGGVTISVNNLYNSLLSKGVVCYFRKDFRFNCRYDVGHIHASNKYKRLLQIVFLKLFCRKVIFTVHGLWLSKSIINRVSFYLSDGVIFLNQEIYNKWAYRNEKKCIILPTLYKEGVPEVSKKNRTDRNNLTLLIYSNSRKFKDGEEVYGVNFTFDALKNKKCKIIFIDLSGEYSQMVKEYSGLPVIEYYKGAVDFDYMLSKSDIYLRPTCMDGSSLAVQEALLKGTRVVASNVVCRDKNVDTYEFSNKVDFLYQIFNKNKNDIKFELLSVEHYLDFLDGI